MEEATKYLIGQGLLGVINLVLGVVCLKLWQENKHLNERLIIKSEKSEEKSIEIANRVTAAFEGIERKMQVRRPTRASKVVQGGEDE